MNQTVECQRGRIATQSVRRETSLDAVFVCGAGSRMDVSNHGLFRHHFALNMTPVVALLALAAPACGPDGGAPLTVSPALALGAPVNEVSAPASNPSSDAKVALGRDLFWDPVLSGNRDV